ncbi:hypothetical protein [Flavobacterium hercynium]|uniref:Uncharacterized protein n=1 Tax=Flavobacterium hercynium TaxID=387094 RepID=A0A226H3D9_9FLAO|nr:hypothetical protein [Flavobacterium hercynium]OXA88398.1 hypothetical protein B0A66_15790 [Flavobacterium hercynium]SMP30906.1 hypothetical protein SAMN06265346_113141 [Flavobacterium hercynium]
MIDETNKLERQLAANLVKEYFNKKISKSELEKRFPSFENDYKIRALFYKIKYEPKRLLFFGVSRYQKFIKETYEIIEELESDKMQFRTMKALFKMLWLQSNNCSKDIENMSFVLFEVSKMTGNSKKEIYKYLELLVEKDCIENISINPFLYRFTEKGKSINTDFEIKECFKEFLIER